MTADLGYGMTLVALGLALYGGIAAGVGARSGRTALIESAQHAAVGVFVLVTSCFALLTYAFLTFDFSVRYVATNTNLGTPFATTDTVVLTPYVGGATPTVVTLAAANADQGKQISEWRCTGSTAAVQKYLPGSCK